MTAGCWDALLVLQDLAEVICTINMRCFSQGPEFKPKQWTWFTPNEKKKKKKKRNLGLTPPPHFLKGELIHWVDKTIKYVTNSQAVTNKTAWQDAPFALQILAEAISILETSGQIIFNKNFFEFNEKSLTTKVSWKILFHNLFSASKKDSAICDMLLLFKSKFGLSMLWHSFQTHHHH